MQQRYYDPVIGRFLSVDPINAFGTGDMRFFTRYAYGFNNPYTFMDPDGRGTCPGSKRGECIQSDTYDANRSNGQTTQASSAVAQTMVSQKGVVAVPKGGTKEKIAFVKGDGNGGHKAELASDATTGSTSRTDSATATVPEGAEAVLHGHIDGRTDGVVSPGDAGPLKSGLPNGVVSEGRVGVTEIVNGQLQFRMLDGKMTPHEIKALQKSLDKQQIQFMAPGQ